MHLLRKGLNILSINITRLGHNRKPGPATPHGRTKSVEPGSQEHTADEPDCMFITYKIQINSYNEQCLDIFLI